jgi:hypothetical protein
VLVTVVRTVLVLVVLGVLLVAVVVRVAGRCIEGVLLLRRLGCVFLLVVLLVLVRLVALVMVLLNCSLEEFLYGQSLRGLV